MINILYYIAYNIVLYKRSEDKIAWFLQYLRVHYKILKI